MFCNVFVSFERAKFFFSPVPLPLHRFAFPYYESLCFQSWGETGMSIRCKLAQIEGSSSFEIQFLGCAERVRT